MPKVKTKKGAAKRFRITRRGKVMARHSRRRHLLECKSKAKKRFLRSAVKVSSTEIKKVKRMLPYG